MGDYGGYGALMEAASMEHRYETSCPTCGNVLSENSRGLSDCPLGHWAGVIERFEDDTEPLGTNITLYPRSTGVVERTINVAGEGRITR